jgi:hypothetical protein
MNKWTHLKKYAMPLLEEIFDALRQTNFFNTLDLWSSYVQLPLNNDTKIKTT